MANIDSGSCYGGAVAKLGMSLGDLMELHKGLTELNEAARRAGVHPAPAPAKDSI